MAAEARFLTDDRALYIGIQKHFLAEGDTVVLHPSDQIADGKEVTESG